MKFLVGIVVAFCALTAKADYVLDFNATWCGPCQSMNPKVEALQKEGYDIRSADIDKYKELAKSYHVTNIPCFVYVHEDAKHRCYECGRRVGACSTNELRRLCDTPLAATAEGAVKGTLRILFTGKL